MFLAPFAPTHNYYPLKEVIKLWILWTVLIVIGVYILTIPAALVIDTIVAKPSDNWMSVYRVYRKSIPRKIEYRLLNDLSNPPQVRPHALIWVPGILARENQVEPLMGLYDDFDIYAVKYGGLRFDGTSEEEPALAQLIIELSNSYKSITIVGASHGGMLAIRAIARLDETTHGTIGEIKFVDCPSGIKSLPVPPFAAKLFTTLKPGRLTNVVLGFVLPLMNQLPKDENIKLPSPENLQLMFLDPNMTREEYVAWVKACAKTNLSGHKFSMWFSELGHMIEAGQQGGLPFKALQGIKNVSYIACMLKGNVISQPQALETYQAGIPKLDVRTLQVTHCGFNEDHDTYTRVM